MTSWHLEELLAQQEQDAHNYCQNRGCTDGEFYPGSTVECEECHTRVCKSCAVHFEDYDLCVNCHGAQSDPADLPAEAYDADDFRDQMGNR